MKKSEFKSPLSLNKEVISQLEDENMYNIKGGADGGEEQRGFLSIGKKCTHDQTCSSFTAYSVGVFCSGPKCPGDNPSL